MVAVLLAASSGTASLGTAHAGTPARETPDRPQATADVGQVVDRIVEGRLAEHRIPGAAVTVVAGGRTVFSKGYGSADLEHHTPVSASRTGFFPGSVVKLFTATAASRLIAEGRLDPDADVNQYLSSFTIHDTYPGRPVTMHALLTHTAGFDQDFVGLNSATGRDVATLGDSLADLQPAHVRPPGTVVAYDNYGFALAGHLIEVISGQPYDEYVRRTVLAPLGMSSTTLRQPHPDSVAATLATGYRPDGDGYTAAAGQYGPWTPTGAGAVTTADDMARFMIAQLGHDPRLGAGVTELMQRPHYRQDERVPGMGYGFAEAERDGHRLLLKDGDLPGFHSNMALLPDSGVGVYVSYNGDGTDGTAFWDGKDLARQVVDLYLAPGPPPPAAAATTTDPARYVGAYRASTTSRNSLMKISALTSPVTVEAAAGGGLTTSGLSMDPEQGVQHWVQRGPGLFAEVGGPDRIAFDPAGVLVGSGPEATAYERLPWYENPALHTGLLGFGLAGLLVAVVWFPVAAVLRRRRLRPRHCAGARFARAAGWTTGALAALFTCGFAALAADGNAMMEAGVLGPPLITILPFVPAAMILTSAGVVGAAPIAWRNRWWRLPGRLGYTMLALAAVAFLAVCVHYNLVALGDHRG